MSHYRRLEHAALLGVASALMATWLSLWVAWCQVVWSGGAALPAYWPVMLALVALFSAWLTDQLLQRRRLAQRSVRASLAVLGTLFVLALAGLAAGVRLRAEDLFTGPRLAELAAPAGPAFMAGLYAWWKGEQLGRSPLGNQALRSAFYAGVIALAPLLALNSLTGALSSGQVLGALLVFFGLGLSGLALSSLRQVRQQQAASRLAAASIGRQWALISAAVIGLLLAGGLTIARIAIPEALQTLRASLGALADGVVYAIGVVLAPLAALADRLLAPGLPRLAALLARILEAMALVLTRLNALFELFVGFVTHGGSGTDLVRRLHAFLTSPLFQAGSRWAGLLVLLAAAAAIFWLAARRLWALQSPDEDELRESVLSGRLIAAQIKNLLRRRPRRTASEAAYLALSGAPDDARYVIRRAYQGMLEWARSLRLPRAAGQTPRAYALMLAGAIPEGHEAIDLLTQAYVLARYAAEAPSLEQARSAEGAMARLRALHS